MSLNVLVTGAGGGSGLSAIRVLKETTEYNIVGADCNEYSTGLELADYKVIVPRADDPNFISFIKEVVDKYRIDVILPNVDDELEVFAKNEFLLNQLLTSRLKTVIICNDKLMTALSLMEIVPTPDIYDEDILNLSKLEYPVIMKPRVSRGSRNIFKAEDKRQLIAIQNYFNSIGLYPENRILLEYLPGEEYTIDCLFDLRGELICAVPRCRLATTGSICSIGRVEKNIELIDYVKKISKVLEFRGPINIQFRKDKQGHLKILEINARIAGGTAISLKAGVNIPKLSVDVHANRDIHESETEFEEKIIFRYLTEV